MGIVGIQNSMINLYISRQQMSTTIWAYFSVRDNKHIKKNLEHDYMMTSVGAR